MSRSCSLRLLACVVATACCLAVSGCGSKYDGVSKEEAQPVVTLLDQEALGHANVDRLEGKKVKEDVLIVRALYRNNEGKKMELMFRLENGKVTGRGFNQFGDDWRNHVDEVQKEIK